MSWISQTKKARRWRNGSGAILPLVVACAVVLTGIGAALIYLTMGIGAVNEVQNAADAGTLAVAKALATQPYVTLDEVSQQYGNPLVREFFRNAGDGPNRDRINLSNINKLIGQTMLVQANQEHIQLFFQSTPLHLQFPYSYVPDSVLPPMGKFIDPKLQDDAGKMKQALFQIMAALNVKLEQASQFKPIYEPVANSNSLRMFAAAKQTVPRLNVQNVDKVFANAGTDSNLQLQDPAVPDHCNLRKQLFKYTQFGSSPQINMPPRALKGYMDEVGMGLFLLPKSGQLPHIISVTQSKAMMPSNPGNTLPADLKRAALQLAALPNSLQVSGQAGSDANKQVLSTAVIGLSQPVVPKLSNGSILIYNGTDTYRQTREGSQFGLDPRTLRVFRRGMKLVVSPQDLKNNYPNEVLPPPPGGEFIPGQVGTIYRLMEQIHRGNPLTYGTPGFQYEGTDMFHRMQDIWRYCTQIAPKTTRADLEQIFRSETLAPGERIWLVNDGNDRIMATRTKPDFYNYGWYEEYNTPLQHYTFWAGNPAVPGGKVTVDWCQYKGHLSVPLINVNGKGVVDPNGITECDIRDCMSSSYTTGAKGKPVLIVNFATEATQSLQAQIQAETQRRRKWRRKWWKNF